MFKTLKLLAQNNQWKMIQLFLISIGEAIFGFVPVFVLYSLLCDILEKTFSIDDLCRSIFLLLAGTLLRILCSFLSLTVSRKNGALMVKDLRLRLGEHIRKLSLGFFDSHETGELSNKLLENINKMEIILVMLVPEMISGFTLAFLMVSGLFLVEPRMALAALITMPLALAVIVWAKGIMAQRGKLLYAASYDLADSLLEFTSGIKYVKAFNKAEHKLRGLIARMNTYRIQCLRTEGFLSPVMVLAGVFIDVGMVSIMLMGAYFLIGGTVDAKAFVIFIVVGSRFFDNLKGLAANYIKVKYLGIAGHSVSEMLETSLPYGEGKTFYDSNNIEFKEVTFSYGKMPVLHHINLKIPEKSMTAFVGVSGSGKSTIMHLIARFYDPQKGSVILGGCDLRKIDPEVLLREMSMVFQKVFLFCDTVYNNIAMGKVGATEDEIIKAAKKANAHDFILKLPQGYQTQIGENGANLSGGEQQRISIARAILKDAPIILLDEATASLDPENEVFIQEAIDHLLKNKTVVVIAHRLKTIQHAHQIVVLDQGKIVANGNHEFLLEKSILYQNLWNKQCNAVGWQAGHLGVSK